MSPKLIHLSTIPETLKSFFTGQIRYLIADGFEVQVISSPKGLTEFSKEAGITIHPVPMTRQISPLADLKALFKIYQLLKKYKPDIVHAHTPKAGLLGTIAARMARIPFVLYTMHGLPFVTAIGIKKQILIVTEYFSCLLAHKVLAVSFANKKLAVDIKICPKDKITVLGSGSCTGVDAKNRFNPDNINPEEILKLKRKFDIPEASIIIGFVGRIVRDKGIIELAKAWKSIKQKHQQCYLLLIGDQEPQDPVPAEVIRSLKEDDRVRFVGWADPVKFYALIDIAVLPTYREGFPVVPLEAAAMEVPMVATSVDGCVEAVLDNVTGILVPPRDALSLTEALEKLIVNQSLRRRMGREGRKRVLKEFDPEILFELYAQTYRKNLAGKSFR